MSSPPDSPLHRIKSESGKRVEALARGREEERGVGGLCEGPCVPGSMLSGVADEAFSSVSAGKLKRWLLSKDVDVSGCIEKSDLIKRAKNLRLPFHELLVPPAQKLKRQGPSSDGKSGFVFLGDNIPVRNKVGAALYSLKLGVYARTGLKRKRTLTQTLPLLKSTLPEQQEAPFWSVRSGCHLVQRGSEEDSPVSQHLAVGQ